jgi:O-antigen/teichoic acid export membrane protein
LTPETAPAGAPVSTDGDLIRADLTTVARGGALNLVGAIAGAAFSFGLVVIVTRGLESTDTGVFFEAIACFHILVTVAQWGAEVGVVRTIPRYRVLDRHLDVRGGILAGVIPAALLGVALGIALFASADSLGSWLTNGMHGDDLSPILRALAPFLPIAAVYNVALAATRGFGTMVPATLVDRFGRSAAQPILALAALSAGLGVSALVIAWAGPYVAALAVVVWWIVIRLRRLERRVEGNRPTGRRSLFVEFWRFAGPRGLASVCAVVILWVNTLLIGALRSPAEAGTYAAATRYLVFGQLIGLAVAQVIGPKLSEVLATGDRERTHSVYATATWWLIALAWPFYLTMIIMAPALLSIFGTGFGEAQVVLVILGASMLVATAVGPVDIVLLMGGKSSWNLANTVVALVVNVTMNLLLIPRWGIAGAGVAWGASILVNNLLPLAQVWVFMGLHPFGAGSLMAGGSALVSFGLVEGLARSLGAASLASLLLAVLVGGVLHVAILWRFREPLHILTLVGAVRRPRRRPTTPSVEITDQWG